MNHMNNNKKNRFAKRPAAFVLAAVSCFSVAALPQSAFGGLVSDIAITADAAVTYKILFDTNGKPESNRELAVDHNYVSSNKKFCLRFQSDGNLVVYRYSDKKGNYDARWNSRTCGYKGARCILQADGNLVIYTKDMKPIWHTSTHNNRKAQLRLADDGELTVYSAQRGRTMWSNNSHSKPDDESQSTYIWPCPGHTALSDYYSTGGNGHREHHGVDFSDGSIYGARVVAVADGTVEIVGSNCPHTSTRCDCNGGCGKYVQIRHSDGKITRYLHLSGFASGLKNGDRVTQGQTIGYVGNSGDSTGAHLHFDVQLGKTYRDFVNPMQYLPK